MADNSHWRKRYTRELRLGGEVFRTIVPPTPPDLDPEVFNMESAWWGPPTAESPSGWRATKHGCGNTIYLRQCGCDVCTERADRMDRAMYPGRYQDADTIIEPFKVPAAPAREHLAALVDAGWTLTDVADEARVDASTLSRLRRSNAAMVANATAEGILGIKIEIHASTRCDTKE